LTEKITRRNLFGDDGSTLLCNRNELAKTNKSTFRELFAIIFKNINKVKTKTRCIALYAICSYGGKRRRRKVHFFAPPCRTNGAEVRQSRKEIPQKAMPSPLSGKVRAIVRFQPDIILLAAVSAIHPGQPERPERLVCGLGAACPEQSIPPPPHQRESGRQARCCFRRMFC
jgi:hypothetical protein